MAGFVRVICMLVLVVCHSAPVCADTKPITVFAASSLKGPLDKAADAWARETGARVRLSFGSSAVLAKQISFGAPADLYISAHPRWMDWLADAGHLESGTRKGFLSNRLVFVAPRASEIALDMTHGFPLVEALAGGRLALGNPVSVPAGLYAREALTSLGVWDAVKNQTAFAENVRVALQYVARGEAPLGVVYQSDARAEPRVRVVGLIPTTAHSQIRYEIAETQQSKSAAAAFLMWLIRSEVAVTAFEDAGFGARPTAPPAHQAPR